MTAASKRKGMPPKQEEVSPSIQAKVTSAADFMKPLFLMATFYTILFIGFPLVYELWKSRHSVLENLNSNILNDSFFNGIENSLDFSDTLTLALFTYGYLEFSSLTQAYDLDIEARKWLDFERSLHSRIRECFYRHSKRLDKPEGLVSEGDQRNRISQALKAQKDDEFIFDPIEEENTKAARFMIDILCAGTGAISIATMVKICTKSDPFNILQIIVIFITIISLALRYAKISHQISTIYENRALEIKALYVSGKAFAAALNLGETKVKDRKGALKDARKSQSCIKKIFQFWQYRGIAHRFLNTIDTDPHLRKRDFIFLLYISLYTAGIIAEPYMHQPANIYHFYTFSLFALFVLYLYLLYSNAAYINTQLKSILLSNFFFNNDSQAALFQRTLDEDDAYTPNRILRAILGLLICAYGPASIVDILIKFEFSLTIALGASILLTILFIYFSISLTNSFSFWIHGKYYSSLDDIITGGLETIFQLVDAETENSSLRDVASGDSLYGQECSPELILQRGWYLKFSLFVRLRKLGSSASPEPFRGK